MIDDRRVTGGNEEDSSCKKKMEGRTPLKTEKEERIKDKWSSKRYLETESADEKKKKKTRQVARGRMLTEICSNSSISQGSHTKYKNNRVKKK